MYLYKLMNPICRMPLTLPTCLACAESTRLADDAPDSQARQANVRFVKVVDQKRCFEFIPTGTRPAGTLSVCDFGKLMTKSFLRRQEPCDYANLMTKKRHPLPARSGKPLAEKPVPVRSFEFAHEKEKSPRSDPRTAGAPRAEHGKNKSQRRKMPSPFPHFPEITGIEVEPIREEGITVRNIKFAHEKSPLAGPWTARLAKTQDLTQIIHKHEK